MLCYNAQVIPNGDVLDGAYPRTLVLEEENGT